MALVVVVLVFLFWLLRIMCFLARSTRNSKRAANLQRYFWLVLVSALDCKRIPRHCELQGNAYYCPVRRQERALFSTGARLSVTQLEREKNIRQQLMMTRVQSFPRFKHLYWLHYNVYLLIRDIGTSRLPPDADVTGFPMLF